MGIQTSLPFSYRCNPTVAKRSNVNIYLGWIIGKQLLCCSTLSDASCIELHRTWLRNTAHGVISSQNNLLKNRTKQTTRILFKRMYFAPSARGWVCFGGVSSSVRSSATPLPSVLVWPPAIFCQQISRLFASELFMFRSDTQRKRLLLWSSDQLVPSW